VIDTLITISRFLSEPRRLLILSHKNPDGDAVGSAIGLQLILRNAGHQVKVGVPDDAPVFLKWLPGNEEVLVFEKKSGKKAITEEFEKCDMVICVDFNSPDRLAEMESLFLARKAPALLIDHHPGRGEFTDHAVVNPSLGSTSELVFKIVRELGWLNHVSADAATCLLAGIMTDTVGFKVSCSYPEIFETVAELMRLGADKDRIHDEVYNQFSAWRMKLLGYSLEQKMKVLTNLNTAYIALTRNELSRYHHKKGDTEGFVNYPLSIAKVKFSVLFTEQEDHVKLSLRSRGTFPANEFATRFFNGGGHVNAAGGRFFGTMEEALDHFEKVLESYRALLVK
jgi:phosphoesterase RecJ-like protein